MGGMSKGSNTLPERPLPPSLGEQDEDISAAQESDAVFVLGQYVFAEYGAGIPSTPTVESHSSSVSGLDASTDSTSSLPSNEQIKESYSNVKELLTLYSQLVDVPSDLDNKYSKLKKTSEELKDSISQLRSLSDDFTKGTSHKEGDHKKEQSLSSAKIKSKDKGRKKK